MRTPKDRVVAGSNPARSTHLGWEIARQRWLVIAIGVFSREALSFWTGHPWDFEVWIRNAYWVSQGHNPYALLPSIPNLSFAFTNQPMPSVGYLPLWSLMLAGLYKVYLLLPGGNRFALYFLLKQPGILGDLLLGYTLSKAILRWGGSGTASNRAFNLWIVLPYPIIISAIWGQFDSLVALTWLISLYVASSINRSTWLGLGILLKSFPLITIPYHLLRRHWISFRGASVALILPTAFTLLLFEASGWSYGGLGNIAFTAHGTLGGMTYANILFTPPLASIIPTSDLFYIGTAAIWIVAVMFASFVAAKRFGEDSVETLIQAMILITGVFFLTRWSINEQYLIYLLPLLLIDVSIWHPERAALLQATWILGLIFLIINNDLFLRFLGPLYPSTVALDTTLAFDSAIAGLRYALLDITGIMFSMNILQLVLVTLNPSRSSKPWLLKFTVHNRN